MSAMVNGSAGSVANLPLVDLLQVWSLNRFSGMIAVSSLGRQGQVYFVAGEVVHAEADGAEGEAAVRAIVSWPPGSVDPNPNTTTLKRTIQKRLSHLLLDAHRQIDEHRRAASPPGAAPTPAPVPRASILDQIRAIQGVRRLVRFGADGRAVGDESTEGEALAAKGFYLARNHAGVVARAFGLRELAVAWLEGDRESLVVIRGQGSSLCLAVAPGVAVEPIVAELRAILKRPQGS